MTVSRASDYISPAAIASADQLTRNTGPSSADRYICNKASC